MDGPFILAGSTVVLLFMVVIVGIGGILILVTIQNKRAKEARYKEMGFSPADRSNDLNNQKILAVHRTSPNQRLSLSNIFFKPIPSGSLYFYDLVDNSGGETTYVGSSLLAVISSDLSLPIFRLIPKPNRDSNNSSFLIQTTEKLFRWMMSRNHSTLINFPENPQFDCRYYLFAQDPEMALNFFTHSRLTFFAYLERLYQIDAGRDTFSLNRKHSFNRKKIENDSYAMELFISDARTILDRLSD